MTPPDGLSNGGAALERRNLGYDGPRAAQQFADRQAVVEDGLFPPVDVAVCPACRINPAAAGSHCADCAAGDAS